MKKTLVILLILSFFVNIELVYANIMCNDGTESPTCTTCHQGCCSWHGGCASSNSNRYSSENKDSYDEDNYHDDEEKEDKDYWDTIFLIITIALFFGEPIYSFIQNKLNKQKK